MLYPQVFESLGFSDKETTVYLSLLSLGPSIVTEVAKKSGINRTSCYDLLSVLLKRGVVSKYQKKKKTFFSANDPRKLLNYLDREKEEFERSVNEKKKLVENIIPELISTINFSTTKPKVEFYEGVKGMREAYEDTLTSKGEILAYANVETVHEGLPNFFPEYYMRRAESGIKIKGIFPNNHLSLERAKQNKKEQRETIILGDESLTFSPEVNIYNDKMLVASWKEKIAVIIESKELADLQRLIYNLLWESLKKDPKNIVST